MGKLLISHRYNRIPLLNSLPGGFYRSWSYKTYPSAKVTLFFKSAKRKRKIRKKSRRAAHLRTGTEETTRESSRIPAPHDVPSGTGAFVSRPPFGCPRQPHGASSGPKPRPDRRRLGKTANFVCFCARLALSLFENSRQCVANSSSASASSSCCSQASASTSATVFTETAYWNDGRSTCGRDRSTARSKIRSTPRSHTPPSSGSTPAISNSTGRSNPGTTCWNRE